MQTGTMSASYGRSQAWAYASIHQARGSDSGRHWEAVILVHDLVDPHSKVLVTIVIQLQRHDGDHFLRVLRHGQAVDCGGLVGLSWRKWRRKVTIKLNSKKNQHEKRNRKEIGSGAGE